MALLNLIVCPAHAWDKQHEAGHTHQFYEERVNDGLVLNPDELLGLLGRPSYCVYDTDTRASERTEFDQ